MSKVLKNDNVALKCMHTACSLDICLTNRCNMACRYCYYETLNSGKPTFLSFEQVKTGIENYMRGRDISKIEKIAIAGGEPFLCFPVVDKTVRFLRKKVKYPLKIEVFTNGILLNEDNVSRLLEQGVKLVLSLDGVMSSNDRNRVFRANSLSSPFEIVMKNLEKIPTELVRNISVGMTVTSNNVMDIADNVKFLRSLNFKEVQINMKYLEVWDAGSLKLLKIGLERLASYYKELVPAGISSFNTFRFGLDFLQLKERGEALSCLPGFREVSLGPDGFFYPCGLVSTYGKNRYKYRIGDIKSGLDYIKAARLRVSAARFLRKTDKRYNLTKYISNPILLYFGIKLKGIDPDKLFGSTVNVFRIFEEKLGQYLRAEGIMSDLSRDRKFGDMEHLPPRICDKEIKRLKVELNEKYGELADLREAFDYFIYSKGNFKELVFFISGSCDVFEIFEKIVFYSLMKTKMLGKKLRIIAEVSDYCLDFGEIEFLAEHNIFLCVRNVENIAGSKFKYLLKKLGSDRLICGLNIMHGENPQRRIKKIVYRGASIVRLEIKIPAEASLNSCLKFSASLEKTGRYLKGLQGVFIENCAPYLARNGGSSTACVSFDCGGNICLTVQNIQKERVGSSLSSKQAFDTMVLKWWKKLSVEMYLHDRKRRNLAVSALKNLKLASGLFSGEIDKRSND
ncbi:MAG: radical SAM protein [Elusimicrobia bacterium]|nr:radical SAM protein [Elusimicrobiota bacterium]